MAFLASYPGSCGWCGQRFEEGARVKYDESGDNDQEDSILVLDHGCMSEDHKVQVPSAREQAEARAKRCGRCFLVHGKYQEECA